ncbi:hypothetical protein MRX96_004227 [Rhipicephalus microplus]
MECSILAAFKVNEVTWRHQGRNLAPAPAEGLLMTSRYLVIRRVNAGHTGSYTCSINKAEGDYIESTPFELRVQYSPRCDQEAEQVIEVERNVTLNVTCDVRANPSHRLRYFWLLENASEVADQALENPRKVDKKAIPGPQVTDSAHLEIVANASLFDALLSCWAENSVGLQKRRCSFKFLPRGTGQHPTSTSEYWWKCKTLRCATASERSFWSSDWNTPMFVTGLRPSTDYLVVVRMPPKASFRTYVRTLSPAQTLKEREDTTALTQPDQWTLRFVLVSGALLAVAAALLGICFVHVYKNRRKRPKVTCRHSDSVPEGRSDSMYIRDKALYVATAEPC